MAGAEVQEIHCKTLINRIDVPGFPFRWTMNPYRGCRHACRYCYARPTHEYWGFDSGREFEQRVFAKVNAPEVLRQELLRPRWMGEPIAIGTASDPYEPAESQYKLTRRILEVLRDHRNPASITTKGIMARRDVDVLKELNEEAGARVSFSVGSIDERVWKDTEPGAPSPMARLETMRFLVEQGVPAGVSMAPILPGISDSPESIDEVVATAAAYGAQYLSANLLFLKPGSKEWFMPYIKEAHPHLIPGYSKIYRRTYAPHEYTSRVLQVVDDARRRWGLPKALPVREMAAPQLQLEMALTA